MHQGCDKDTRDAALSREGNATHNNQINNTGNVAAETKWDWVDLVRRPSTVKMRSLSASTA